ncbi:MAG: hypothetical protein HEQ39_03685 [Rhizobacter sp.]
MLLSASAWTAPVSANDQNIDPAAVPKQAVMQVGPGRAITTLREAARQAQDGMLIEVDAGRYFRDVAVWTQNNLTLRAVGGRAQLVAGGASAENKATWVVRAQNMTVEGFDFEGAASTHHNGAGIRFERGSLRIRDCSFSHNQMGVLTADDPGTTPQSTLDVENSEFSHNSRPDGHNHQLYVGRMARLTVTGSYFHHGRVGHLLKSRAAVNHIHYNRLTDELGGNASYELEFPEGGVATVVGNLIIQGSQTQNPHLIAFGAEGLRWPRSELYIVNNTLVDNLPKGGVYLRTAPGTQVIKAVNNLLVGGKEDIAPFKAGWVFNNVKADWDDFVLAAREDFRLKPKSRLRGRAVDPGAGPQLQGNDAGEWSIQPKQEYRHPRQVSAPLAPSKNLGAFMQ